MSIAPDRIRDERKRRGLSQTAAAEEVGVTFVTWNRWENGHQTPTGTARKLLTIWLKKGSRS